MSKRRDIAYELNEKGCHVCTSHKPDAHGYPQFQRDGRPRLVYVYLYRQVYGNIAKGLVLHHICENKMCINIAHIVVKTVSKHMNGHLKGKRPSSARLSDAQVRCIRSNKTLKQKHLGFLYGVTQSMISKIKSNVTYRETT